MNRRTGPAFGVGIRGRLVFAAFLCLAAPLYLLNRYAIHTFDRFTRTALEEEMTGHARMTGALYAAFVPALTSAAAPETRAFADLLRAFSTNANAHIQIVDTNGIVRFDGSDADTIGASLADRREIREALAGRYGARWALTSDRHFVYYYCAVPIVIGDRPVAAVCITRHTGPITSAIRRLADNQSRAFAAALVFAAVVSILLGQTMTRRLRRLTAGARDYARGRMPPPRTRTGHDEIAELEGAIDHMARDLEARHRYNRDFVATTLHELKTPVTAIRGAVEVLEAGAVDKLDTRAKFLANLRFEADRLTRLVGELGELTRIDTEDLGEKRVPTDYGACVRDIVERLGPAFAAPHAALATDIASERLTAAVVPERIEQVLANLMENAMRYTPPDGTVTVRVGRARTGEIQTSVEDTGPGIPTANLDRIFDRFFTTEPKGVPRDYGTGLGLAVARGIVERHGGHIRAENRPAGGACFSFTLPAA